MLDLKYEPFPLLHMPVAKYEFDQDTKELEKKFDSLVENVDKRFSRFAYSAATGVKHSGSGEVWLHRLDDVDYNKKFDSLKNL